MSDNQSEKAEKTNSYTLDLVGEFFYEFISRVVPGMVVIALYFRGTVWKWFTGLHDASIAVSIGVVVAAWLIGAVLDSAVFSILAYGLKGLHWLNSKGKWIPNKCKEWIPSKCKEWISNKYKGWISKKYEECFTGSQLPMEGRDRVNRQKSIGERVMIRSLCLVSLVTIFVPPKLGAMTWSGWHGGGASLVFVGIWLVSRDLGLRLIEPPK